MKEPPHGGDHDHLCQRRHRRNSRRRDRHFRFSGCPYSIDLAQENLDKLTKALAPFVANATRQRGATLSVVGDKSRTKAKAERPYEISDLREWADKNKVSVPQRGRIPAAVVEQYLAAGGH